jgi:predicted nucleic acid-binding protein
MVLVDTSIWIDHLRNKNKALISLLARGNVCVHDFIIGELACGNIKNRKEILELLSALPTISLATHAEVLFFIENHHLFGVGLGWVDMHLLSACLINSHSLWTFDKKLAFVASRISNHT